MSRKMDDPIVRLSAEDFMVAATKGGVRQLMSIKKGRMGSDHGGKSKRKMSQRLADSALGELGEIAVSRVTGMIVTSEFENTKAEDVGGRLEVRTTEYLNGSLLLYKTSPDQAIHVLVTIDGLNAKVCGWIRAIDGKLQEYWREGDPGCFYVPQHALEPINSLPNE